MTLTECVSNIQVTEGVSLKGVEFLVHQNVERIRIAKGKTKTFVAGKLKLSLQGYRHIANGNTRLDTERLKVIGEALEEDPAVFLSDELTESVVSRMAGQVTSTA